MGSLITCIQVDADAYEHSPERKAVSSSYFQMQQEVVIQDTVIDALTGGLFAVYLPEFIGIPWDVQMEVQVCVVLYINGASIAAWGTCFCLGTADDFRRFSICFNHY